MTATERMSRLRAQRREMGVCTDCGGELDKPGTFLRCMACRDKTKKYSQDWRETQRKEDAKSIELVNADPQVMRKQIQNQIEADKRMRQANRCLKCPYGTYTGVSVHCPFPEGVCMKR